MTSSKKSRSIYNYKIESKGSEPFTVSLPEGRDQWAFSELVKAGTYGCTPIDTPGPRWSAYVFTLRHEHGVPITTVNETHGGKYSGNHARYVLACNVTLVSVKEAA